MASPSLPRSRSPSPRRMPGIGLGLMGGGIAGSGSGSGSGSVPGVGVGAGSGARSVGSMSSRSDRGEDGGWFDRMKAAYSRIESTPPLPSHSFSSSTSLSVPPTDPALTDDPTPEAELEILYNMVASDPRVLARQEAREFFEGTAGAGDGSSTGSVEERVGGVRDEGGMGDEGAEDDIEEDGEGDDIDFSLGEDDEEEDSGGAAATGDREEEDDMGSDPLYKAMQEVEEGSHGQEDPLMIEGDDIDPDAPILPPLSREEMLGEGDDGEGEGDGGGGRERSGREVEDRRSVDHLG